jgi:cyclopropane fatty-acyl-phospholipid synthase-like methyltransferase
MEKPFSPSCERNQGPILTVLQRHFGDRTLVLEIGSGTGQHAVHFAQAMPHLRWQASDVTANLPGISMWLNDAALPNTPAPLDLDVGLLSAEENLGGREVRYDALFSANTLHIISWPQVQRLFDRLPSLLTDEAVVAIYGPFNYDGRFTSESNAAFNDWLQSRGEHMAIRDFEAVDELAAAAGLKLIEDAGMPSNNRTLVWRRA